METLIPIEAAAGTGLLLALDVDGVTNRFNHDQGPVRRLVRTAHGKKYWIDFDPDIVKALDDVVRTHGIEVGWLTTWGPNVRALVEQAFDGKLAGGYVLKKMPARYRGAIPADWKYTGLQHRLAVTGQLWAWADDEAIAMQRMTDPDFADKLGPGLLLECDPVAGITFEQIQELADYAAAA